MEGMFWPTMLAFAPLWAWIPLSVIQGLLLWLTTSWPWYLRFAPFWVYALSFAPMLYGLFAESRS